jgi:hypothetical protein
VETVPGTAKLYDADNTELVTLADESAAEFQGTGSAIGLFAFFENGVARANSSSRSLRIYSFKVTNAYGDKTLDLIPVLDKESVPCMYDKVSGEYFYNTNGETFIAGGAV